ncbi:MAG: Abi family protein [Sediminibacterium sp.]
MARVPYNKPALTHADQLQQLKDRGLLIENDAKALHLLDTLSYYRLSGYWHPMLAEPKSAHIFKPGSSFNNAFKIYCFDRELRKLVLSELEKIEVAIRSKMIYLISHRHTAFWFNNPALFSHEATRVKSVVNLTQEFGRSDELFIKSFKKNYSDPLPPSWMILEISSFGNLSYLYKNLRPGNDKRDIADYFGLDDSTFESWLHSIVYIRNVCAHHARLWNKIMSISPKIPLTPSKDWIVVPVAVNNRTGLSAPVNNRMYFILSMVVYLLETVNPKHTFKERLGNLFSKYPNIDLRAMGFPANWKTEPLWTTKKVPFYKKIGDWIATRIASKHILR